jgi:tetratricopeptide (TPR) repeat protein
LSVRSLVIVFGLCATPYVAVVGRMPAQAEDASGVTLKISTPLERELSRSERHRFQVPLQAGDYAHLTVDQQGIDVIVHVLDASGNTIADVDAESTTLGAESVGIVADIATTYRVEIAAAYPKYGSGRYTIRLDEERAAGDADRGLFEAHRLQTEAARLETAGKYEAAQELAARALDLGEHAAGQRDAYVGYLATRLAELDRTRGDQLNAERLFRQAIAVDEMALGRRHPQTAYALLRLSALYLAQEAFTRAEPLAEEALAITEHTLGSDHPRVASCLIVMSLVHSRRDNLDRAVPELQRALTIAERAFNPDDSILLAILNNLGDLYALRKDFDRAEPLLTRALEGI